MSALLFGASQASATVVYDATSSQSAASGSTTVTFTHTLGTGASRLLVCGVSISNPVTALASQTPTITFGTATLHAIPASLGANPNTSKIESILLYANDTDLGALSGAQTVTVTLGTAPGGGVVAGCTSFFGVAQAAPATAAGYYSGSGGGAPGILSLVAPSAGDLIVDFFAGGYTAAASGKTAAANAGQTQNYVTQLSTAGVLGGASFILAPTAGTNSIGWSDTVSRLGYSGAVFAATATPSYAVTTSVSPVGSGTVALSPNQSSYTSGSVVQVTATPAANYTFTGFSGALTGTTNPQNLTVDSAKSLTANFAIAQCTLTMNVVGQGTVTPNSGTYNCGSTINLTATPANGYSFGNWSGTGGYNGTNATASFTLSTNVTETATFVLGTTCTLATSVTGNGSITLNPAGGSYSCGTDVAVTAVPFSSDYTFNGFTGALTGTTNPQTVHLTTNSNVAASFTQTSFPINVTIVGPGSVTRNPNAASYATGTQVQLTAVPDVGAHFVGFTGDLTSTTNPSTVTVNATKNITATFAASTITLDHTGHGATVGAQSSLSWSHVLGSGVSRMVVISVGSTDSVASPDANAVVSSVLFNGVYATPIPNSLIYGGTSGMVQTQLFYLTEAELPAAGTYTVQVNLVGAIAGLQAGSVSFIGVTQGPAEAVMTHRDTTGADLISTSITTLSPNDYVVDIVEDNNVAALTANSGQVLAFTQSATSGTGGSSTKLVPAAGVATLGWAGSASRLAHSLAAFAPAGDVIPATYTLTTSVGAGGGGTISSNPNIATLPIGTAVLLTATAANGFAFNGWSGDVTSTTNPLQVIFDANHTITANFIAVPTCTIAYTIIGTGTVTPAPGAYNCGSTLTLTATPGSGYSFTSYSGDFSSTDNPAQFTITQDSNVTVQFDAVPMCSLTLNKVGQGTVTPASGSYACNSVITLTATAANGYAFSGFTGDFASTANPAQLILDQDKVITANFTQGAACSLTTSVTGNGSIVPSSGAYACGTTITMQALPATHYLFNGWGGALASAGTTTPTTLTLDTNKTVTASFLQNLSGVTGDARTVVEPVFPPVCTTLTAVMSTASPVETSPDTARVQSAIDACPAGQAVQFSTSGSNDGFLIQPIVLKAGVTMLLDPGVTVMASIKAADYACDQASSWCTPVINIATNADPAVGSGIMGYGVIDGRGGVKLTDKTTSWWGTGSNARPRLVYLGFRTGSTYADNFTMYKVTVKNSPKFHISGLGNNQTMWGIKIVAPPDSPNTDGYDPSGSKNITITQSFISDGDDMIAVKAGAGHVSNVTISNNHMYSGHGISVGSETNAGLNNMFVHDNVIDNAFGGSSLDSIRIKSDVSRGGEVYDVLYKNTCILHGGDTIVFDPYYSSKSGTLIPNIHDITVQNFHELIRDSGHKTTMQGYNTAGTVYPLTVTLDNVQFDGATLNDFSAPTQVNNAQFTLGPGPVNIASFLMTGASVPSNNISVTNNVANSNAAFDCTNAFVYLAGELAGPSASVTAGSSPVVTAIVQNIAQPLVNGTTTSPYQKTPTGTVRLLEGGTVVGSATLTGRLAPITIAGITSGTHTYTAQYVGDTNYPTGLTFGTVTVTATTGVTPPVAAAQSVNVAFNTATPITLSATGTGTLVYSIVAAPTNGTLSGTAPNVSYTPNAGYAGADSFTFKANNGADSNVATVSITVAKAATSLTLATPSPSNGLSTNQTTTLTATLSPVTAGASTATGTITFSDAGTAVCQGVSFNATTGVASCTTPGLALGSHTFTAAYTGDSRFAASTSNTQVVTVSTALASLTVSGFPATDHIGTAHSVTVTAKDSTNTAITGYTGTVTLSSSDTHATLPAPYTFLASENGVHTFTVTLNTGGPQTITATSGAVSGFQTGIVVDDYVWLVNSNGTLTKLDETGGTIMGPLGTSGATATYAGVAFDNSGAVWSVNSSSNSVLHATKTGGSPTTYTGGGVNAPVGIFIDGAGQAWIANSNNTISVFSNNGTAITPATGYQSSTAHQASALNLPSSISIDSSGVVWITNTGNGKVTKIFGAAAPVVSPTSTAVTNNTLGVQP